MSKGYGQRAGALALAVVLAASLLSPFAVYAEEFPQPEAIALPAETELTATPAPTEAPTATPETAAEPTATPEPTPEPVYELVCDNKAAIEAQRQAGLDAGQPEAEIVCDPFFSAMLTSEAGFPNGSRAELALLKDEALDSCKQSLRESLTAAAQAEDPAAPAREVTVWLPLELGIVDTGDPLGKVSVTLTVEDPEVLQEKELYHQKGDGTWEKLDYTVTVPEYATPETAQREPGTVEFTTESFSPFLFVEAADVIVPAETEYTYEDDEVFVRAVVPAEAMLPAGAVLHAEALTVGSEAYQAAYEAIAASLGLEEGEAFAFAPFDVYFTDENGARVEPAEGLVRVELSLKNDPFAGLAPEDSDVQVAHIKEDDGVEFLPSSGETAASLAFNTASFSIFAPVMVLAAQEGAESVTITSFNVAFSSGATQIGSGDTATCVWNPTEPAAGHSFVYRSDYAVSWTSTAGPHAIEITLPLHILKDRDGNWADQFGCPYLSTGELTEGDEPDFAYEIDAVNNTVTIYNCKTLDRGDAGYIEFSYTTTEPTFNYVDMAKSDDVHATLTVTGADSNRKEETVTAAPVYINTYVTINKTEKESPTYYETWQESWGAQPGDAADFYYLVWPVCTNINKCTSAYNFTLTDTFADFGGSVVGYRFAGQKEYSITSTVENQRAYGNRYDYVLTRYKKAELSDPDHYEVHNDVTATVDPVDQVDEDTTASGNKNWWYEAPKYIYPTGHFWAEKYGIYGGYRHVKSSEDISDYTLGEFADRRQDQIDSLEYHVNALGYPYPWTLPSDATGTEQDAIDGKFGQKKVAYDLADDVFYLEEEQLTDADYDLTSIEWTYVMRTAAYNRQKREFVSGAIETYKDEDAVTLWVRTADSPDWQKAAVYDLQTKLYQEVADSLIQSTSGRDVTFQPGIKGVRLTCSNAYYYTQIDLYPTVSLKGTDHVLGLVGTDKSKVRLTNEADFTVTQDNEVLFERTVQATDYIQRVERNATLKKDLAASRNDKVSKQYVVTWRVQMQETYRDNDSLHYVPQQGGTFYDLISEGAVVDPASVEVMSAGKILPAGSYTVTVTENYRGSGRTLLTVAIPTEGKNGYILTYDTIHQWNAIQDYGRNLLNSAAYETGNADIGGGYPNNGGTITDKELLTGLGDGSNAEKYLYAEARHTITVVMAANTGMMKQVKGPNEEQYSDYATISNNGVYSYRIRLANDDSTQSRDIIFFDSLENFYQGEGDPARTSDWKGTLTGVDLSAMRQKGIDPVVYLSDKDGLNPNLHHDLAETAEDGSKIWLPYEDFVRTRGLAAARAVAVDATRSTSGAKYLLPAGNSVVFTLYLQAPAADTTGKADPTAYNNIYVSRTAIAESEGTQTEIDQFFHQDYTQIHYRITADLRLLKVDATDGQTPVEGVTYQLRGTSDYGTVYEMTSVTARDGSLNFTGIEKGSYELLETDCSADWQLDTEVYGVTVHPDATVTVTGLAQNGDGRFILEDEPRIHADLVFEKRDSVTNALLNGAEFRLSGVSDYGNDLLMYATSEGTVAGNPQGRVRFENIELGTYTLIETQTVEGYCKATSRWTVKVDERGIAVLYKENEDGTLTQAETSRAGYYQIKNEPLHTVQFLKSSSYGDNIYLEGATFSLTGVSEYGTRVNATAVSASAADFGMVTFDGLEPGTYTLKETAAPADHVLDDTIRTVKVYHDGTFEILGMEKEPIEGLDNVPMYNIKNDRTTGAVTVTKIWQDDKTNDERTDVPVITISTVKPSSNPNGYSITFMTNGGEFADGSTSNTVVYNNSNQIVAGTQYKAPTHGEGYNFVGWYTKAEDGTKYAIDLTTGIPTALLTEDITLYAFWQKPARYAVQLYDIGVDTDINSNPMGLTFGPALGADYVNSFKKHTPTDTTTSGNAHRCLHDDEWATIIAWNNTDPYVYEQCIAEHCTHSVEIKQEKILGGNADFIPDYTGDGPSVLYWECGIGSSACWNEQYSSTNAGGWGASGMRALLNGKDTNNTDSITTLYAAQDWTADNCLLAAFPAELQAAIGARETAYDLPSDSISPTTKVTYDKLWLFGFNELSEDIYTHGYYHTSEAAVLYKRWTGSSLSTGNGNVEYRGYRVNDAGNESQSGSFWLRTVEGQAGYGGGVITVSTSGQAGFTVANGYYAERGVAPGFSLSRNAPSSISTAALTTSVTETRAASYAAAGAGSSTAEYTTQGGAWIEAGANLWAIDKDSDGVADTEADGQYSVTMTKNGDEWVYTFAVPDSTANYFAWEEPVDGYTIVDDYGSRATPAQTSNTKGLVITNRSPDAPEYGSLNLSKVISGGSGADRNDLFLFTIRLTGDEAAAAKYLTGIRTFGDVTFQDGVATVYLKHGESVTMTKLPAGIQYKVEETPSDKYRIRWEYRNQTGTITADETINVVCTNIKRTISTDVWIGKIVQNGTPGDIFDFHILLWNLAKNAEYFYYDNDYNEVTFTSDASGSADLQITLQAGQGIEFYEVLPVGCQVQVLETASDGYVASYSLYCDAMSEEKANSAAGRDLSTSKITLKEFIEVNFTNTKPAADPNLTEVTVAKLWQGDDEAIRPESITVYLLRSVSATEPGDVAATAILDKTNGWTYTFTDLDKFQPDGTTPYLYTVQEAQVPGYTSAITGDAETGYTVTNTRIPVGQLKISKTVGGMEHDTTAFRFTLKLTEADGVTPITGTFKLVPGENAKTGTLNFDADGQATFTLKQNESLTLKDLPAGATYTLTEAGYAGYRLETPEDGMSGTITENATAEVAVQNRRLRDLTVSKTVAGSMGDKTKDFAFTLTLRVPDGKTVAIPQEVAATKGGETLTLTVTDGKAAFTLAHGESITFKDLPTELAYKVEETADDYTVEVSGEAEGVLLDDVAISFTNTRKGTVPTNVLMTVLPFLLFTLLGGAGIFWQLTRKKRRARGQ